MQRKGNSREPFCVMSAVVLRAVTVLSFGLALQACTLLPNYNQDPNSRTFPEFDAGPSDRASSDQLKSLHEASLKALPNSSCSSVYRFLWFRTFHNWISIRVEHHKDSTTKVYAKELDRRGAVEPKPPLEDLELDWSAEQYARFMRKIDSMKFWDSPSVITITQRQLATDGASWILEGVDQQRCHFIARGPATIDRNPALKELGIFLLTETKLLPPKEQIY